MNNSELRTITFEMIKNEPFEMLYFYGLEQMLYTTIVIIINHITRTITSPQTFNSFINHFNDRNGNVNWKRMFVFE